MDFRVEVPTDLLCVVCLEGAKRKIVSEFGKRIREWNSRTVLFAFRMEQGIVNGNGLHRSMVQDSGSCANGKKAF